MKIKSEITNLAKWAEKNRMTLVYLGGAWVMLFFTLWSSSLLIGFWANALAGMKFELGAGISGIGTIASAGATIYGIAKSVQEQYATDSQYNSPLGEKPKTAKTDEKGAQL